MNAGPVEELTTKDLMLYVGGAMVLIIVLGAVIVYTILLVFG